ncbi:multicopper oxidase family protein [Kutzneria sp. CA-103260]|uniref:multicopper oxidase family protein n=1 Tax=Kutzneria sp. CA-103260 TaxID=2802641 RepID=UPI001BAAA2AF|nr:multicopper oxidase domain-containing protein [Kutzneria sp. CA-103260]QUQ69930.1 Multicopper oxidase [Kutzneria sp. CA-103260]
MYVIALIAEFLTSLLLVVALAIRFGRKWTAGTLLVLKVGLAALMLMYGFEFAVRPLRDLALLAVAFAFPQRQKLLIVAAAAGFVLDLLLPQAVPQWTAVGMFAVAGLLVALPVRRWVAPVAFVVLAALGVGIWIPASAAPATMNMGMPAMPGMAMRSVTQLTGPPTTGPVRKLTITARQNGDRYSFSPNVIRLQQGDVLDATLVNKTPDTPVTIHWHGLDVPNAYDGVAGITQDAVKPGGAFEYKFQVNQVGTYWFHSHEDTKDEVVRGLFGLIVVEPRTGPVADLDQALMIHTWGDQLSFGDNPGVQVKQVKPGSSVRVRVVNTDSDLQSVQVTGSPWQLAAVDGNDLHQPGTLTDQTVPIGGGGRADIQLTMPDHPVRVSLAGESPAYVLSPDGKSTVDDQSPGPAVDLMHYGTPAPVSLGTNYNRDYTVDLDQGIGASGFKWTMNGGVFPDAPMLMVTEGDTVRVTFRNLSLGEHPMHLHGHEVLVLSRDGVASAGSPVWMDTVSVEPGETVTVAFKADNPGIWMDHCHNLGHAKIGMVMHLAYTDVTTPFVVGDGNNPE